MAAATGESAPLDGGLWLLIRDSSSRRVGEPVLEGPHGSLASVVSGYKSSREGRLQQHLFLSCDTALRKSFGSQHFLRRPNVADLLVHAALRYKTSGGLFPNEATALRLVSTVVMEITEEWKTGKMYLSMDLKAQENG